MDPRELERLRKIEKLAWEVIKPKSERAHEAAMDALRRELLKGHPLAAKDLRRGAVTVRIVEKDE